MAKDARAGTERVVMHRDVAPAQKRINRIADTATLERTFSLSGIPACSTLLAAAQSVHGWIWR